jgi:hypothetical protein
MKLLTKEIREKLIKNHIKSSSNGLHNLEEVDHKPVVKFFCPYGAATYLITELDPETDMMFGLCDLGFGFPELGYVSLTELSEAKVNLFGVNVPAIEREIYWSAEKTLSEYTEEAYTKGSIAA